MVNNKIKILANDEKNEECIANFCDENDKRWVQWYWLEKAEFGKEEDNENDYDVNLGCHKKE